VGPRDLIRQARRHRKAFGGAMRQVGFLAAAAVYALDHHIERLAEDHRHAQRFAELVKKLPGVELCPPRVDTNIVIFKIDPAVATAADVVQRAKAAGLMMLALGPQTIRIVTHLDVTGENVERAGEILQQVWNQLGGGPAKSENGGRVVSVA
jgi:threonine aldolase